MLLLAFFCLFVPVMLYTLFFMKPTDFGYGWEEESQLAGVISGEFNIPEDPEKFRRTALLPGRKAQKKVEFDGRTTIIGNPPPPEQLLRNKIVTNSNCILSIGDKIYVDSREIVEYLRRLDKKRKEAYVTGHHEQRKSR